MTQKMTSVEIREELYTFKLGSKQPLRHKLAIRRFFKDCDPGNPGSFMKAIEEDFDTYLDILHKTTKIPVKVLDDLDEEELNSVTQALFPSDPPKAGEEKPAGAQTPTS